ncbi:hypothetical protein OAS39_12935, partial [Pirellulales bacterium]|nr:hypothetical protein [Pirellulales bacterium]
LVAMRSIARLPVLICFLLSLTSCGGNREGFERVVLSGKVSFEGAVVAKGRIRLTPQERTTGPVSVEHIRDGVYRCDYKGGVPVGTHLVQIWSYDPNQEESFGPGGPPVRQYLPPKYNSKSELVITVEKADGEAVHDFDLD